MQIRPAKPADLEQLNDIDGTVESSQYLHLEKTGEGLTPAWKFEQRALRTKLIDPNPMDDETKFAIKQIAGGMDEGLALVAEHEGLDGGDRLVTAPEVTGRGGRLGHREVAHLPVVRRVAEPGLAEEVAEEQDAVPVLRVRRQVARWAAEVEQPALRSADPVLRRELQYQGQRGEVPSNGAPAPAVPSPEDAVEPAAGARGINATE